MHVCVCVCVCVCACVHACVMNLKYAELKVDIVCPASFLSKTDSFTACSVISVFPQSIKL